MFSFMQKTIIEVNNDLQQGKTVITHAEPVHSGGTRSDALPQVDVVTSPTIGNHLYNLPHPVPLPVKPVK